jgi:hypothetical protein
MWDPWHQSQGYHLLECLVTTTVNIQGDTKKWELVKNPTKIEEMYRDSMPLTVPLIHDY